VEADPSGGWQVHGITQEKIGDVAASHGIAIHELQPLRSSLEEVYSLVTETSVEFRRTSEGHHGE
jgi:ABC-2 type transport system ATP-binding protein